MTFVDGKQLTAAEFFALMRGEEAAGDAEYDRRGLVRRGDAWVTPETAQEIDAEIAA